MKLKLLILSGLLLCINNTFAQTHTQEVGIVSENDSFLAQGSDRYYTNGLFIYYNQALTVPEGTSLANKVLGIEVGQKIFNPISGSVPDKSYIDRPFAGYLYLGSSLNLLYKNESNLKLGAQVGVVGPAALGRQAQQVIHDTFGFYELNGWQYQVKNNVQINLSAEYNRLLARGGDADVSLTSYANVGTGFNGVGVGPMFRIGNFNQLFNSYSTQSTAIKNRTAEPLHKYELFLFYKPLFNYVAYDATVQGNIFKNKDDANEVTLTPKHIMISNQIGLAYGGSRWMAQLSATFHTRDVKEMMKSSHQWGTAALYYRFN
ncbi:lipid A deacylase LpxR family protein [Mucilaginibacter gynuensis]|uniref:Lipid A deacylase LpxR family protein n=1 Tax=Mucilaginibacter gynuensis TaxID=1302236 RepID=A0ABP8HBW2_9SPHI